MSRVEMRDYNYNQYWSYLLTGTNHIWYFSVLRGMDSVTFSIYGCTWLIGVCLPVIVFWLYRTLSKMRYTLYIIIIYPLETLHDLQSK